jgi:hypothetical protein
MVSYDTGPPLAPLSQLLTALGAGANETKAREALAEASGRFRGAVRWQVSFGGRTDYLDGSGLRTLTLPAMAIDPGTVQITHIPTGEGLRVSASAAGIVQRTDGHVFPVGIGNLLASYMAGYDPIPEDIQAVVLDQAKAIFQTRRGLSALQVGSIMVSQGAQEALGVTEAWSDTVAAYRRGPTGA